MLGDRFSSSCAVASAAGRVALLELVEKAVINNGRIWRKNASGERWARKRSHTDMVPNNCSINAAARPITNTDKVSKISIPTFTMTL
jgi:hypothetical protein